MAGERETSRLALEVRFGAEPIEGRVSDDAGALDRPFSGWLGLMSAIEAARPDGTRHPHDGKGEPR